MQCTCVPKEFRERRDWCPRGWLVCMSHTGAIPPFGGGTVIGCARGDTPTFSPWAWCREAPHVRGVLPCIESRVKTRGITTLICSARNPAVWQGGLAPTYACQSRLLPPIIAPFGANASRLSKPPGGLYPLPRLIHRADSL